VINGLDWEAYAKHAEENGWTMKFTGNVPLVSVAVIDGNNVISRGQGSCLRSAIYDSALRLRPQYDLIKEGAYA
jgi:hypothetical protein